MDSQIARRYIEENFEPSDRLAVVLLQKRTGAVTQRIAVAERIIAPEFQAWLRYKNAHQHEVYISMNSLKADARGRTKSDVAAIRHLYLDFDEDGTESIKQLLNRQDVPRPNYRISSSPGKWQAVWKVKDFSLEQAERLQRWLARDTGADAAATDAARVLRLPGFYNHKYEHRHFVSVESLSGRIHVPKDFPELTRHPDEASQRAAVPRRMSQGGLSQSERDWAFAKRALARGEPEDLVAAAIAILRRDEKHDPYYYARLTVRKAAAALAQEQPYASARSNELDR
jgi:hypothetical protein